ncbi:MAG: hypothetical protein KBA26_08315 [Candidatus Delongbacteria bacterium]|nr:hypothetical protein [Candidatus Delongbacteria bacterium]
MKRYGMIQTVWLILLVVMSIGPVVAQDSRVPGGNDKTVLNPEARNGKLVFESADKSFQWWFDSRIQIDGAKYFENKNKMSDGTLFRRLTFAMKSTLWNDWQAEVDLDFAEATLDLRDMWIQYTIPGKTISLRAGNFKEPFGMERLNSSRLLTFLERTAATNAFSMGRRMGGMARYWNNLGQVSAGVFGHEAGTRIDKGTRDEGYSTNLRVTVAPINQHGKNLHIGLAGTYKIPDATDDLAENTIEIKTRTETYVFDPKLLHTGDITDVNYYNRYGGELMMIYGPLYVQSEYMMTQIKRWYGKETVDLNGGYAMLTYTLTGETRYYYLDEGEVGPIEAPRSKKGAVEVAARYSIIDLDDPTAGILGGKSNQLMLGINYYPNPNIKLQFNYSLVDLNENATSKKKFIGNDDHSFIQFRIQASL